LRGEILNDDEDVSVEGFGELRLKFSDGWHIALSRQYDGDVS